jgi:hypothetical protein
LKERKEIWEREEAERIANLPDPSIPPGHVIMPKQQRLQTLEALKENQSQMMKEIQSLSLTADTLRVRKRRNELEYKLIEIEDAISIFSKPKVFIKMDT